MKKIIIFLVIILSFIGGYAMADKEKVEWVGLVAVGNDDPYWGNVGWLPGIQLGLRDDGVIVWRKKPVKD